ncbi:NAD(P)-dependent oxidoreductase [Cereibacter sp. SYSU M97828]|nr:NAD(P)-dependent oxidoreductase [Cereibacter flavus]
MKVAVLGASGRAGSQIVQELARRGHEVRAIARNPGNVPAGVTAVAGDASDAGALAGLIAGSDAVISALHHDIPASTILGALREAGVPRLLVTGGAGSLRIADGTRVIDTPDFPEEWRAFAQKGVAFLDDLRAETQIDWTFFSPAALIFDGPRKGTFRLGTDNLVVDDKGESSISFADFAIAMVDELEQHRHPRARFTAAY